jgi:hypothetical protein
MFHLLYVAASSHGPHTAGATATHATQVPAFDNLEDDSSPDVRNTPSLEKTVEKHTSSPPSVSSEYLCFSFALLLWALINDLQILLGLHHL